MDACAFLPLQALAVYAAVGALAGVLAGLLGIGGGLVIVPTLFWVFAAQGMGESVLAHLAIGTSLASIALTSVSSVIAHGRRKAVLWGLVARLAPGVLIGAWAASALADMLPTLWLQRVFALFALFVGARMLLGKGERLAGQLPGTLGLSAAAVGVGGLSALVGIGGGSLTVPFLARCGVDLRNAVATSSACGLPIALAGAAGYAVAGWGEAQLPPAASGYVYWPAVVGVVFASVPLAPLGAMLAHRLPVRTLRRTFGGLLLVVGLRMLWQ